MATAIPIASNIDWNDWLISSLVPPVSSLTPAGSGTDCTNAVARCEMPLVSVPSMTALTATSRVPSRRLMLFGAVWFVIVATSLRAAPAPTGRSLRRSTVTKAGSSRRLTGGPLPPRLPSDMGERACATSWATSRGLRPCADAFLGSTSTESCGLAAARSDWTSLNSESCWSLATIRSDAWRRASASCPLARASNRLDPGPKEAVWICPLPTP